MWRGRYLEGLGSWDGHIDTTRICKPLCKKGVGGICIPINVKAFEDNNVTNNINDMYQARGYV